MFYIALCDDSKADLNILTGHLSELHTRYRFEETTYQSGPELVELYKSGRRFHLVVLDMMMQPLTGIETAQQIRRYDTDVPILIVTATPEYAIDGYKVGASRYILKPVERTGFLHEVCAILDRELAARGHYFSFSCESGIVKVELERILYFESALRTITLHTQDATYTFTGRIRELTEQLSEQDFVRVHKSFVVSLRAIHRIFKDTITLSDGSSVPLSKNKSREVHSLLLAYMERNVL